MQVTAICDMRGGCGEAGGGCAHTSCPSSFTRAEAREERTGCVSKIINLSDLLAGIVYAQTVLGTTKPHAL